MAALSLLGLRRAIGFVGLPANGPAAGFEWNFSFGNGFQGTNLVGNNLYVMVLLPR